MSVLLLLMAAVVVFVWFTRFYLHVPATTTPPAEVPPGSIPLPPVEVVAWQWPEFLGVWTTVLVLIGLFALILYFWGKLAGRKLVAVLLGLGLLFFLPLLPWSTWVSMAKLEAIQSSFYSLSTAQIGALVFWGAFIALAVAIVLALAKQGRVAWGLVALTGLGLLAYWLAPYAPCFTDKCFAVQAEEAKVEAAKRAAGAVAEQQRKQVASAVDSACLPAKTIRHHFGADKGQPVGEGRCAQVFWYAGHCIWVQQRSSDRKLGPYCNSKTDTLPTDVEYAWSADMPFTDDVWRGPAQLTRIFEWR